jgi:two-component system sensor histidine kinase DegS
MYDLAPPVLQNLGLKAALEEALADLQTRFKINTTLSIQGEPFVLNLSFRSVFFRMTRELLMNVVKHAKAQSVHVDLAYETDSVSVVVKDDGVGFDTNKEAKASEVGSGLGLWSVRDQAQRLGGVFDVQSTPGEGAAVLLKLPIVKQEVLHDKAEE